MRYLVTGGAGFIGSHLVDHLLAGGHEVVVVDNLGTGSLDNLAQHNGSEHLRLIESDVDASGVLEDWVPLVDAVFHLASPVGVKLVMLDPRDITKSIARDAWAVSLMCSANEKPLLFTSTSEVYGAAINGPLREDQPCCIGPPTSPRWAYAAAKAAAEYAVLSNWWKNEVPAVVVRLFNTVGPRQVGDHGMVLPRFVEQAMSGEPITVCGDGEQTRSFCHVADIVPALEKLIHCSDAYGQVVNLGSDVEVRINRLAECVKDFALSESEIRHVSYREMYGTDFEDMHRRVPCIEKAEALIGFHREWLLQDIVRDIIRRTAPEDA